MDPTAIVSLASEALKLLNALYADEPPALRRANGMLWWNIAKIVLHPLLTADQRKELDAVEAASK